MDENYTILCIDDDQAIQKLIKDYFTELGYQVFLAGDGEAGLKLFGERKC